MSFHGLLGETFRFYADRLAHILVEEALAMLATSPIVVQTHTGGLYAGIEFDPNLKLCVVSILRAGDRSSQISCLFHFLASFLSLGF